MLRSLVNVEHESHGTGGNPAKSGPSGHNCNKPHVGELGRHPSADPLLRMSSQLHLGTHLGQRRGRIDGGGLSRGSRSRIGLGHRFEGMRNDRCDGEQQTWGSEPFLRNDSQLPLLTASQRQRNQDLLLLRASVVEKPIHFNVTEPTREPVFVSIERLRLRHLRDQGCTAGSEDRTRTRHGGMG